MCEFGTVCMPRQEQACIDEFLARVTEGVVDSVYKVMTRSSFGVIQRHEVSGGTWTFLHCVTMLHTNLGQ